jgi:hypothetical protein
MPERLQDVLARARAYQLHGPAEAAA